MNRRKHERIQPLVIRTKFSYGGGTQAGYLTNLSEAGAFLATEQTVPIGDKLTLRISLPWQIGEIAVEASVEWDNFDSQSSTEHPRGCGLSFVELSSSAKEKIGVFIQRCHSLVAQLEDQPR